MVATLIELLALRAHDNPGDAAFDFEGAQRTYRELWEEVNRFGSQVLRLGCEPGDRVVVALPNGPDFFTAFYGVQRARCVPIPLYPASGPDRLVNIATHSGARLLVVDAVDRNDLAEAIRGRCPPGIELTTVGGTADSRHARPLPDPAPEDLSFIQYTSGSTGDPKGVQLSHVNVLANLEQLIAGMRITPADVFVSWLPLHHDMGLVLMTMVPFYLGARLFLLPTRLTRVQVWLRAIEQHRGTFTAAPDFAYRFCLRHLKDPGRFDLGALRVALNAAEPVRLRTIREFEHTFGLENVMVPGYGLAEASVGVSTWPPGVPVRADANGFVSVGPPFPHVDLRIDTGSGNPDAPAGSGEILIRSPSVTRGYYGNPRATARLVAPDGFIRTGDLGYQDTDGNLYVVGRLKEIINQGGTVIAPAEAEEVVETLPAVRSCAAVGIDRGGAEGEQAYLFAEIRRTRGAGSAESLQPVAVEIVNRFRAHFGFRPGRVYLLDHRAIPRTPNGKLQRGLLKARFLDGSLSDKALILFPDL